MVLASTTTVTIFTLEIVGTIDLRHRLYGQATGRLGPPRQDGFQDRGAQSGHSGHLAIM